VARTISLRLGSDVTEFSFSKINRERLYGKKERVVVDESGNACRAAWLTVDGSALVLTGGTAHVWVDPAWSAVELDARRAVDAENAPLPLRPSTLGVAQDATPATVERVLEHVVDAVYALSADALGTELRERLEAGEIFEAPFSYRDGYEEDVLFILRTDEGIFGLVSRPTRFSFVSRDALPPDVQGDADDDLEGDLDFSMI
jgi:hypothetical protein